MTKTLRLKGKMLKISWFVIALWLIALEVNAQQEKSRYKLHIDGGKLGSVVQNIHNQTNVEFIYSFDLAEADGIHSVKGTYTLEEALAIMFEGTELSGALTESGMIVITREKKTITIIPEQHMTQDKVKKSFISIISAFIFGMGSSQAQDLDGHNVIKKNETEIVEKILVTATKRPQSLQDVPFGLSAITGADLERIGASGAEDYLAEIPGVHYNALGRGRSPIVIRGISTEGSARNNLQNSTAIYIDELPSLNAWGAWTNTDINTFDLERIEVLRGPQGTIFGSGALGGAVRVITNKPDLGGFESKIEYGESFIDGGDDSHNISGMVNIPLLEDKLALRVVGYTRNDGGYIDNIRRDEKNVNSGTSTGGRIMLGYEPLDNLSLRLTLTHEESTLEDTPESFRDEEDGGTYEYNGTIPNASDMKLTVYNFYADYDFGNVLASSSTTYATRDSIIDTDYVSWMDNTLGGVFGFDQEDPSAYINPDDHNYFIQHSYNTFSQELRFTSTHSGPFQWTFGGFYLKQNLKAYQLWDSKPVGVLLESNYDVRVEEAAIFGEATYNFSEQFSVTLGARSFDSTFEFERKDQTSVFVPAGGVVTPFTTANSSSINPKFSASYFPQKNIHLYTTISKGFRIGQVNFVTAEDAAEGVPIQFDPDSLWNYEVGAKTSLFDHKLSLNAALFYIDWQDIQLQRFVIGPATGLNINITDNAGEAKIKGLEADLVWHPSKGIELGTTITAIDAELDSVLEGVPLTPGSTLPGSADFSAANFIQFSSENLPNDMSGYIRLGHRYVGESVSNINNTEELYSDKYHIFNARAGLWYGSYEFVLYVDNIGNNDAAIVNFPIDPQNQYSRRSSRLQPRTVGLTLRAEF